MSRRAGCSSGIAGIYAIFGPEDRLYVGESCDVLHRDTIKLARMFGMAWTIIKFMPDATITERRAAESLIVAAYRRAGSQVVNRLGLPRHPVWTEENKRRAHERLVGARAALAQLTPEQRGEVAQRAWATRRSKKARK